MDPNIAAPSDRRYTDTHEWCLPQDDLFVVGITQHAADQLTDITFVDAPAVGAAVTAGERFGEIESVKSVSDLIAPISGEVVAVNEALSNDPGLINRDPFGEGWIIRVQPSEPEQVEKLLSAEDYQNQCGH